MSQNRLILGYLQRGRAIDPMVALRMFKCFRLAPRIHELRRSHRIHSEMVKSREGTRYARYRLIADKAA